MGVFNPDEDIFACLETCNTLAWGAVEALLSHFFSPYLIQYDQEDVTWFLKLVNRNWTFKHPIKFCGSVGVIARDNESLSENFSSRLYRKSKV